MCGIVASHHYTNLAPFLAANSIRGRDSWGYWSPAASKRFTHGFRLKDNPTLHGSTFIANLRAEPTTEWVKEKRESDVQPFEVGNWVIVHNGTIANDKELIAAHEFENSTRIDSWVIAALLDRYNDFKTVIKMLIGSYAICAVDKRNPSIINFAMNYKPLYYHDDQDFGGVLSSVALAVDDRLLPPYSIGALINVPGRRLVFESLLPKPNIDKALVVCSGGLDSTVTAAALQHVGMNVELLHFNYGCRATRQEITAIKNIAAALKVSYQIITTPIFTDVIKGSPLTNTARNESFAESEIGAEFAHEWVPARNLIMLGIATGIAESHNFNVLALGANLEESGAYPDNEQVFFDCYARMLPYAVRANTPIRLEMPVVNLMKHEIVRLGLQLNAPLHLTWSCYNDSEQHCGNCGPCFMRRTAFEMNGQKDPVFQ